MEPKIVMAIDPGNVESAYVIWDGDAILKFDKVENNELKFQFDSLDFDVAVMEEVASYGMPVGRDVFDTVFWTGRFFEKLIQNGEVLVKRQLRKDVKMHLCGSNQAKDSNITTALVDRFGNRQEHGKYSKGTKKNPGFFYGFYKDIWQAFALAVYYYDIHVQ
jgi:hypothetical protein